MPRESYLTVRTRPLEGVCTCVCNFIKNRVVRLQRPPSTADRVNIVREPCVLCRTNQLDCRPDIQRPPPPTSLNLHDFPNALNGERTLENLLPDKRLYRRRERSRVEPWSFAVENSRSQISRESSAYGLRTTNDGRGIRRKVGTSVKSKTKRTLLQNGRLVRELVTHTHYVSFAMDRHKNLLRF